MKNRAFHGAGEGDDGGSQRRNYKKNQKKNKQRLGGSGLSLEAFANAKSRASGYNPALIKKQKEFYRNAKYVSKFKKSMKRESQSEDQHPAASRLEDVDANENEAKPLKCKKKKISLQTTREEYEKRQAELEKAKLEKEAIIQAKKEERATAEARRKALRENMFKKTRSGQPVMKYRIGHLLEGLLQNPTG